MRKTFLIITVSAITFLNFMGSVHAQGFISPGESLDDATSGVSSVRELSDNLSNSGINFWIIFLIFLAMAGSILYFLRKSKKDSSKTTSNKYFIEKLRLVLLIGGLILGMYAMTVDTSLPVNYPMGNSFGLPERVNNLGLMSDKQNLLIVAGLIVMVGVVLFFLTNFIKTVPEGEDKQCPECAEKVKIEAKTCRFCNYKFPAIKHS